MKKISPEIVLEESFVIGWLCVPGALVLFLEVFLTDLHPDYLSPDRGDFGCYRFGIMRFDILGEVIGISGEKAPEKNLQLDEYIDVYEIESFQMMDNKVVISVETNTIEFEFQNYELVLINEEEFRQSIWKFGKRDMSKMIAKDLNNVRGSRDE